MILIQQHLGRIEMHFHIFVSIAVLTIYKDSRPAILAGIITIIYHIIANELQSQNIMIFEMPVYVFNYGCGWGIVLLHGLFVILEVLALYFFITINYKRFVSIIKTKFKLEELTAKQEYEIRQRTSELQSAKEDAEAANRAKSSFLASMSHEIRTPLNAILGFIDILQEQETDSEKSKYIYTIKQSGSSLVEIINDILDFAKVESGKLSVEKTATNLHKELDNIGSLFFAKSEEIGIEFHIYIDPLLPLCIESDPLRIRQVLTNLLSNAMKFSKEGGIVLLEVKYSNFEKAMTFKVRDGGIGIAKENQAKIFEAFSQAEDSTTRQFGGTGLGLAISSKLVELMGGTLEVLSELNEGSEFFFTLPATICDQTAGFDVIPNLSQLDVALLCHEDKRTYSQVLHEYLQSFGMHNFKNIHTIDELPAAESSLLFISSTMLSVEKIQELLNKGYIIIIIKSSLAENYSNVFQGKVFVIDPPFTPSNIYDSLVHLFVKREDLEAVSIDTSKTLTGNILIAEDQEANQYLMSVILKKLNLNYSFAHDGVQAVKMFQEDDYDLIFMDENMPNMNGTQATQEILKIEKDLNKEHTPIIALTANALKGDKERFIQAGMDEYLSKPIEKQKMLLLLHHYLSTDKSDSKETLTIEEPSMTVNSYPHIDVQAIAKKLGYDTEDIETLISMFLSSIDDQIKLIEKSIESKDYKTLFSTAHAIKGSSGNIGLEHIFELCSSIETAAKKEEDIAYDQHLIELKQMIEALKGDFHE